jgi:hypothetical protein
MPFLTVEKEQTEGVQVARRNRANGMTTEAALDEIARRWNAYPALDAEARRVLVGLAREHAEMIEMDEADDAERRYGAALRRGIEALGEKVLA